MEVDFSQLEVVALAILSGDPVLKHDILSGRDMHRARAAELYHVLEELVTDEQRQTCKALSFQLQYGAGYKSMAEKNGVSEAVAKMFIENYYNRYKRVKQWQEEVAADVNASRRPSGEHTPAGYPKGVGVHTSATGRIYKFFEYDNKFGRSDTSFSPTEMKNYPVQGFATGDIMALYRGRVYRRLIADRELLNDVKLINTVHDSVMLDVRDDGMVGYVYGLLKEEAERLPKLIQDLWDIEVDIPFKVECKYGPTWADLVKY